MIMIFQHDSNTETTGSDHKVHQSDFSSMPTILTSLKFADLRMYNFNFLK
jgi:hypothetical protein